MPGNHLLLFTAGWALNDNNYFTGIKFLFIHSIIIFILVNVYFHMKDIRFLMLISAVGSCILMVERNAYVLVHVLNGRHAHSVYSGHGRGLYFPGRPAPLRPANVQLRLGARGIRAYAPRSYPARQVYVGRGSGLRSRRERLPWKYSPLP